MNRSIQVQFFLWIALQAVISFCCIAGVFVLFSVHEIRTYPDIFRSEMKEIAAMLGTMALLAPLSILSAWLIARRLLRPLQHILEPAERISRGQLDERISAPIANDEIGRLAEVLNQAFDRYHHAMQRLRRFSLDASHQLRNPLASLRTSGEICLQQPRSREDYEATIGRMLETTRRLSRTVEQLLMLADAGGGLPRSLMAEVNLGSLLSETVQDAKPIAEMLAIGINTISPDPAPATIGIRDMLREAVANLLDNALKHTPERGAIQLGLALRPGNRVRITVDDSGPGIAPEMAATLFRPFQRGHDPQREGVGLGLAIVADIASAHGGSAGVAKSSLGGCQFWIELPGVNRQS